MLEKHSRVGSHIHSWDRRGETEPAAEAEPRLLMHVRLFESAAANCPERLKTPAPALEMLQVEICEIFKIDPNAFAQLFLGCPILSKKAVPALQQSGGRI